MRNLTRMFICISNEISKIVKIIEYDESSKRRNLVIGDSDIDI